MERLTHKSKNQAGYKANRDVPIWECVDKLGQLEDLEKQGLLLKLPCKVGDTLFAIIQGEIYTLELNDYRRNHAIGGLDLYCINVYDKFDYRYLHTEDYRKTYFLTKREAEQALNGMTAKTAACKKFQYSYSFCKSKRNCSGSKCSFHICTMCVNSECEQRQNNVKKLKEGVMNV